MIFRFRGEAGAQAYSAVFVCTVWVWHMLYVYLANHSYVPSFGFFFFVLSACAGWLRVNA